LPKAKSLEAENLAQRHLGSRGHEGSLTESRRRASALYMA
jgi:hypothetical protein